MATVIEIVQEHLRTKGADGLVCPDAECGCMLGDLVPCGSDFSQCMPGWKGPPEREDHGEWSMYPSKQRAQLAGAQAQEGEK